MVRIKTIQNFRQTHRKEVQRLETHQALMTSSAVKEMTEARMKVVLIQEMKIQKMTKTATKLQTLTTVIKSMMLQTELSKIHMTLTTLKKRHLKRKTHRKTHTQDQTKSRWLMTRRRMRMRKRLPMRNMRKRNPKRQRHCPLLVEATRMKTCHKTLERVTETYNFQIMQKINQL